MEVTNTDDLADPEEPSASDAHFFSVEVTDLAEYVGMVDPDATMPVVSLHAMVGLHTVDTMQVLVDVGVGSSTPSWILAPLNFVSAQAARDINLPLHHPPYPLSRRG